MYVSSTERNILPIQMQYRTLRQSRLYGTYVCIHYSFENMNERMNESFQAIQYSTVQYSETIIVDPSWYIHTYCK